jgi:hypothetical protein
VATDAAGFDFRAEIWIWDGPAAWHFISVPESVADAIADIADGVGTPKRGFGSVRVEVTVGASRWRTSLFPDKGRGTYLLPVKAAVRRAERIAVGDAVAVRLVLVD